MPLVATPSHGQTNTAPADTITLNNLTLTFLGSARGRIKDGEITVDFSFVNGSKNDRRFHEIISTYSGPLSRIVKTRMNEIAAQKGRVVSLVTVKCGDDPADKIMIDLQKTPSRVLH